MVSGPQEPSDKYQRYGFIPTDDPTNLLTSCALRELPPDFVLPPRWAHGGVASFQEKYGHQGIIAWAKSTNSQLLLINGHHIIRCWTDTRKFFRVDVNDSLARVIPANTLNIQLEEVPKSTYKKSAPLTKRVMLSTPEQMHYLVMKIKGLYGLDS